MVFGIEQRAQLARIPAAQERIRGALRVPHADARGEVVEDPILGLERRRDLRRLRADGDRGLRGLLNITLQHMPRVQITSVREQAIAWAKDLAPLTAKGDRHRLQVDVDDLHPGDRAALGDAHAEAILLEDRAQR